METSFSFNSTMSSYSILSQGSIYYFSNVISSSYAKSTAAVFFLRPGPLQREKCQRSYANLDPNFLQVSEKDGKRGEKKGEGRGGEGKEREREIEKEKERRR